MRLRLWPRSRTSSTRAVAASRSPTGRRRRPARISSSCRSSNLYSQWRASAELAAMVAYDSRRRVACIVPDGAAASRPRSDAPAVMDRVAQYARAPSRTARDEQRMRCVFDARRATETRKRLPRAPDARSPRVRTISCAGVVARHEHRRRRSRSRGRRRSRAGRPHPGRRCPRAAGTAPVAGRRPGGHGRCLPSQRCRDPTSRPGRRRCGRAPWPSRSGRVAARRQQVPRRRARRRRCAARRRACAPRLKPTRYIRCVTRSDA